MSARLTDEGIHWRRGFRLFAPRESLLRWDDVVAVDGRVALGRRSERVPLDPASAAAATVAITFPGAGTSPSELESALARPFAAAAAAGRLLEIAGARGATDIHLAPDATGAQLSLRVDGVLAPFARMSDRAAARIVAAWKGLAGCLPYRRDVVQEGRIAREGIAADVRASFVPTAFGERVALRLFGRLRRLSELGLSPDHARALESALETRSGLLLIAGASGSGKTTTLYAALAHLAGIRTGAHLSLEDPVEQRLRAAGIPVDQVELDPANGRGGDAMLAAALRQDVDVIALGEIRTPAEARIALHAAHTGRLVLAGVHAGSPAEARQRLVDLGAEPALLDVTLAGAFHQELVTAQCACARRSGCADCRGTGTRRRALLRGLDVRAHREMAA